MRNILVFTALALTIVGCVRFGFSPNADDPDAPGRIDASALDVFPDVFPDAGLDGRSPFDFPDAGLDGRSPFDFPDAGLDGRSPFDVREDTAEGDGSDPDIVDSLDAPAPEAQTPDLGPAGWPKILGGPLSDLGYGVAVDRRGNIYVTGNFQDTAHLGGSDVASQGASDIFLVSFSATGALRWQKAIGGIGADRGADVVVDDGDNLYVTGSFQDTVDVGGNDIISQGGSDAFLLRFATDTGVLRWQKTIGGISTDSGRGVAVDASGNVYLVGNFQETVDLGGGNVTSNGSHDFFVTSFSPTGGHRWQRAMGNTLVDDVAAVAVSADGNVSLTGTIQGTIDLGGGPTTDSNKNVFVTSFTTTGVHRWQKTLGGLSGDNGYDIAVDMSGNVILTGMFHTNGDFGGGIIASKGDYDIFITSFTSGGVHRWQKALGGSLDDVSHGVAVDINGNITITGRFQETAALGGGNVISRGNSDIFVTSFTSAGVHRWQKTLGGALYDHGRAVAANQGGDIFLTGAFLGTADLGNGNVTSTGSGRQS
ncbi:MAG: SBBP repeat-containing protein [Deltaproteobacteria bacterium]|nr:SBBP repeat-containing protein [Deltaproteobacteria bacterium]